MTARRCQTCKHYEPSAVWRRGWCRNPRLYSPQQSHMVDQDALDCSRGLGCAWEAADDSREEERYPVAKPIRQPLRLFAPQQQLSLAGAGGSTMASSDTNAGGGPSGGGGSFSGSPRSERISPSAGQERTVSYQPEERYWTDYLRIALPLIGVIVLLGVFWFWGMSLIGGGDDDEPTPTSAPAEVSEINASPPPSTMAPTAPVVEPTPGSAPTPVPESQQPPAVQGEPTAPPNGPATEADSEQNPAESEPTASTTSFPVFDVGAAAVTDGPVNVRSEPSTESDQVVQLDDGTSVTITGEQVADGDGGNIEWYPIETEDGQSGFIREDLFVPAE